MLGTDLAIGAAGCQTCGEVGGVEGLEGQVHGDREQAVAQLLAQGRVKLGRPLSR
jgi:hypothetical protein